MSRIHLIGQLPPPLHGSSYSAVLLRQELTRAGHTVTVTSKRFSSDAAEVGAIGIRKLVKAPALAGRLIRDLRRARPDVVIHYTTNRPGSFLVDLVLLMLVRLVARRPVVGYVHTVGFARLATRGHLWRWSVRHHLGGFSRLVTLGPSIRQDVEPFTTRPVTVIKNGIPAPVGPSRTPPVGGPVRIGHLSNLSVAKGALTFLDLAHDAGPGVEAHLAGPMADDAVTAALGSRPRPGLTVWGPVAGAEKDRFLHGIEIFVFPSTYAFEAQPFVIIEALAAGAAILAYDVGGIRDLVRHEENGLLVPGGDRDGLAVALRRLVDDATLRARLRSGALRSFDGHHSLAAFRASWVQTIHALGDRP